ncbi:maleylpyruvate isomerase family mycothiol-dependent enzyme [Streptomyces sp. NPDC053427]|uniref:maleylpyruvate isomerase family mycothiol-dependent enzyme n=1 Tax=Streptomyces sp. NPDC053427 TaxID=3365701 RepID=UPI0037D17592
MPSPSMSYERHCAEIVAQTALLRSHLKGADLTAPVSGCPDWTLGQLLRHLGGAHRWAETVVRTRATQLVPDDQVNDVSGFHDEDPAALGAWLAEGAGQLADALRAAGPDAAVWTVVPGGTPVFWARRMTHETVVHRADVAFAVGAEFGVDEAVAVDALDEWMAFGALPQVLEATSKIRDLLGRPSSTLHFHATDASSQATAEWLIDLTGDAPTWRRAHEKATVAVRGPLADLLLLVYGRRRPHGDGIEILGDARLLDVWLDGVSFWLKE